MWKKEIMDTLKQTALVLSFMLILPVAFGINQLMLPENMPASTYADFGRLITLPALILYLAYMMFSSDDNDSAAEYLQSLPISKWKLMLIKVLPRFLVSMILLFIFFSSFVPFTFIKADSVFWSLFTLQIMILGFFMGISARKNIILAFAFLIVIISPLFAGSVILDFIFSQISFESSMMLHTHPLGSMIVISILLLPSSLAIASLVKVFRSWDVSSGKIRSKRILKRMAMPLGLIIALFTLEQLHVF